MLVQFRLDQEEKLMYDLDDVDTIREQLEQHEFQLIFDRDISLVVVYYLK